MGPLVTRLLLTVSLIPLAIGLLIAVSTSTRVMAHLNRIQTAWVCSMTMMLFVMAYWTLLWRRTIPWTGRRIHRTLIATAISVLLGTALTVILAIWTAFSRWDLPFLINMGILTATMLWLFASTIAWRESHGERTQRTAATTGGDLSGVLLCKQCGYAMTGLPHGRCPECGTEYTLDTLLNDAIERIDRDRQLVDQAGGTYGLHMPPVATRILLSIASLVLAALAGKITSATVNALWEDHCTVYGVLRISLPQTVGLLVLGLSWLFVWRKEIVWGKWNTLATAVIGVLCLAAPTLIAWPRVYYLSRSNRWMLSIAATLFIATVPLLLAFSWHRRSGEKR